jgi:5-dehydro-2-deoxygluconokinase
MGGFLAGLADGRPLRDCVLRGSATAAIVVSAWAVRRPCPPAELDAFMAATA